MRILYVEDNPADADLVRRGLLRAQPPLPSLQVVSSLAQARLALSEPAQFDLALLDLNLPDGHGLELVAEIRQRRLPLAVVVLTGQGDEALVVAALKAGADDYLAKGGELGERIVPTLRACWTRYQAEGDQSAQPLRVLYVEHSAHDRDLTRRHLQQHAAHLLLECVPDAPSALALLPGGAARPDPNLPWDLLLLDFQLVGDNGLELLKLLRQDRGLDLPVVLVTGQGNEEVAALAMRLGATDYLVKSQHYLMALPAVLESAYHRVQLAREHAALRALNATLEHKVAERTAELVKAKANADAANKAKSAFLGRMSHDLRTPLNAVLGFSQLLARDPTLAPAAAARKQVQLIHDAGRHLLAMVDDLLDLSAVESGALRLSLEALDVVVLVQECLQLAAPLAAQHRVTATLLPFDGLCLAMTDRTRLRQVLVNLLSNGIKYNHAGGRLSVAVLRHGPQLRVVVTDTGPGMNAQQLAGLYQPFNRLGAEASEVEGSGLGLLICRNLLLAMNGMLDVHSEPGRGSSFTVSLPRADAADAADAAGPPSSTDDLAEPPPAWSAAPGTGRPRQVLYVEDNPVNVILMREALALRPELALQVAVDAEAALALLGRWRPDLVLLDLDLPGMSGIQLLQHLRADPAHAGLRFVAVSAYALGPEVQHALDQGCSAYLTKPFDIERLFTLIDQYAC